MAEYLVRGAIMACDQGTHTRKLGLLESHGAYLEGKPQIYSDDSIEGVNINYFGICKLGHVSNSEEITLIKCGNDGVKGSTVTGCKCIPKIVGSWRNCKEDNALNGVQVVTTESYLVCQYGGIIEPVSSGQDDRER